jgi:hypothetical protein
MRFVKAFLTVAVVLLGASQVFGQTYRVYNPSTGTWSTYQVLPSTNGFSTWNPQVLPSTNGLPTWNPQVLPSTNPFPTWNPQAGITNYTYGWNGNMNALNPQPGVTYYSVQPTPPGRWVYNRRTGTWTYRYYSR